MSSDFAVLKYSVSLEAFSNELICGLRSSYEPIIESFTDFIKQNGLENPRFIEEYCVEFIMLGVFWRSYIALASAISDKDLNQLIMLSNPRNQKGFLKSLKLKRRKQLIEHIVTVRPSSQTSLRHPGLDEFEHLLLWLTAIGEYSQEVRRLLNWRDHFMNIPAREALEVIGSAIRYAAVFENECSQKLSPLLPGASVPDLNPQKMDGFMQLLPGNSEYYLNAVGACVINTVNRAAFISKPKKMVILPASLCPGDITSCRSVPSEFGYRCESCTQDCQARLVFEQGTRHQFEVYLTRNGSNLFKDSILRGNTKENLAVLSVSPLLELNAAAWKMKSLDIATQCLFLGLPDPEDILKSKSPADLSELLRLLNLDE